MACFAKNSTGTPLFRPGVWFFRDPCHCWVRIGSSVTPLGQTLGLGMVPSKCLEAMTHTYGNVCYSASIWSCWAQDFPCPLLGYSGRKLRDAIVVTQLYCAWMLNSFMFPFAIDSCVDATTFLYFSFFAPLIYVAFLKGFFGWVAQDQEFRGDVLIDISLCCTRVLPICRIKGSDWNREGNLGNQFCISGLEVFPMWPRAVSFYPRLLYMQNRADAMFLSNTSSVSASCLAQTEVN